MDSPSFPAYSATFGRKVQSWNSVIPILRRRAPRAVLRILWLIFRARLLCGKGKTTGVYTQRLSETFSTPAATTPGRSRDLLPPTATVHRAPHTPPLPTASVGTLAFSQRAVQTPSFPNASFGNLAFSHRAVPTPSFPNASFGNLAFSHR